MRSTTLGVLVAILLAACGEHRAARAAVEGAPLSPLERTEAAKRDPVPDGSFAADWQDPSCDLDTARTTQDAAALVREYVARSDSLGFNVGGPRENDDWLLRAAECPGHLGGSDWASIATGHAIDAATVGRDTARFVVRQALAGTLQQDSLGFRFVPSHASRADTVVAVRTPYGWRLAGQVDAVVLSPAAAKRWFKLPAVDVARLDSVVAQRASASARGK